MGVKIVPPPRDFFGDVQLDRVPGVSYDALEGSNPDFTVGGAAETVWAVGGLYVYPAAAATIAIASTDANDTLAGTGAQVVGIDGLDASGDLISETVDMNGVGTVNTVNSYRRVNSLFVAQAGTGGVNAGEIDALHGADILRRIEVGVSRDRSGVVSVPNGKAAVVLDQRWSVDDIGLVEGTTIIQDIATGLRTIGGIVRFGSAGDGYVSTPTGYRFNVGAQIDIEAIAIVATKSGNPPNVAVGVEMGIHVYDV